MYGMFEGMACDAINIINHKIEAYYASCGV